MLVMRTCKELNLQWIVELVISFYNILENVYSYTEHNKDDLTIPFVITAFIWKKTNITKSIILYSNYRTTEQIYCFYTQRVALLLNVNIKKVISMGLFFKDNICAFFAV